MAEYIEREAVYNTLKAMYCDECTDEKCQMCEYAYIMFVLDNLPIADVQPVKRGRWLHDRKAQWKCSECGNFLDFDGLNCGRGTAFFCPNCGADMRGDENA